MKKNNQVIIEFFKQSGLKILIVAIIAIVIVKKDFAFSLNLKSPTRQEVPKQPYIAPQPPQQKAKESKITEQYQEKNQKSSSSKSSILEAKPKPNTSFLQQLKEVDKKMRESYIRRFSHIAVDEMKKYKIPASIILAQALLNSAAGTSDIVQMGKNHFNLTCSNWQGDVINFNDGTCFREFASPWRSYRSHSKYITSGEFVRLRNYGTTNYKKWAKGIEKAKFSTEENYAKQLIATIEKYNLNRFDF